MTQTDTGGDTQTTEMGQNRTQTDEETQDTVRTYTTHTGQGQTTTGRITHSLLIHTYEDTGQRVYDARCGVNNNRGGHWFQNQGPVDCKKCLKVLTHTEDTQTDEENRTEMTHTHNTDSAWIFCAACKDEETQKTQDLVTAQDTETRDLLDSIRMGTRQIQGLATLETLDYSEQETLRSLDSEIWILTQTLGSRRV